MTLRWFREKEGTCNFCCKFEIVSKTKQLLHKYQMGPPDTVSLFIAIEVESSLTELGFFLRKPLEETAHAIKGCYAPGRLVFVTFQVPNSKILHIWLDILK